MACASTPRIIVADDHPTVLEAISRIVEDDFEVVAAVQDGRALVDAALSLQPDLLLSDVTMPRLNGFQAISELRQNGLQVPVVFMSVHEEDEVVRRAEALGAAGYVLKRQAARHLPTALTRALEGGEFFAPANAGNNSS